MAVSRVPSPLTATAYLFLAFIAGLSSLCLGAEAQKLAPAPAPEPYKNCADRGNNLVLSCDAKNVTMEDAIYGADNNNATIKQQIKDEGGPFLTQECCTSWAQFFKQSCRCNPETAAAFNRGFLTDQSFLQVCYAAAIACGEVGFPLYDPQYGLNCSNGVVTAGS